MSELAWLSSDMPVLAYETGIGWPSARKQRLFAAACCHRIPLPEGLSHCVTVAENYADRKARRDDLAGVFARTSREMARSTNYSGVVKECSEIAILWLCDTKYRKYAAQAASYALSAIAYSCLPPKEPNVPPSMSHHEQLWSDAYKAERAAQIELLHDVCGHQFHAVVFPSHWRTDTAVTLARTMYESRDFSAMPILADALQDAGCDNTDILAHCRGPGPHVRGCWVCDLVLSKE